MLRRWLVLMGLAGCGSADFVGDVGATFAACDPATFAALAKEHGMMPAFEPCGANRFHHFAWSPDGRVLYFQLEDTGYLLYADTAERRVETVPTRRPVGPAAWLGPSRLAVPVGGPAPDAGSPRLALYDIDGHTLFERALGELREVHAVARGRRPDEVLVLASTDAGRRIRAVDTGSGAIVADAFPFVPGDVDTFTYTPAVDALVVGQGDRTTLWVAGSGERRGTFRPALRGTVHPDGRWLALEHAGEPVSIFYRRSIDDLPADERRAELARLEALEERVGARGVPTRVRPPTLSLVDLTDGDRYALDSVYGTQLAWYEAAPGYASLLSWGFEGQEHRRNVLLGDLTGRLAGIASGAPTADVSVMLEARREDFVPGILPPQP